MLVGKGYILTRNGKNFIIMVIHLAARGGPWCFSNFFSKTTQGAIGGERVSVGFEWDGDLY